MSKVRFTLNALAVICLTLVFTSLAQAQATRTWVSGVGDDANPCSRTAPCKTFAGAISKTAAGGEIDAIDPGGFGAITITKSITIDGQGTMASILASLTTGVIINANATSDVVNLKNLSINGAGNGINGIRILAAKHVSVENVQIFGFRNTAAGNGRGISDVRTVASTLSVLNAEISNNAKNGIAVLGPVTATLKNVQVLNSSDATTAGIAADAGSKVTMTNSTVAHNLGIGIFAGTAGTVLNVDNCVSVGNNVGVQSGAGAVLRLSNTTIMQNATGINAAGGTLNTFGNNRLVGNTAGNGPFPAGSGITAQ